MSKRNFKLHYINLEEGDQVLVSSENGLSTRYLFNGKGFERMQSATKKKNQKT